MNMNYLALVTLALASSTEEDPILEGFSGDLGEAFKEAQKQKAEKAKKEAVGTIRQLLVNTEANKAHYLVSLRNVRKQEKVIKNQLALLDRVVAYAKTTNNFIPWLKAMGVSYHELGIDREDYEKKSTIPDDWVPPTA